MQRTGWALALGLLVAAVGLAAAPPTARASEGPTFATIERAGPVAPRAALTLDDPELLAELERELKDLPPSTAGFPKWLIHMFQGPERQRSYAVFEEDLGRFPTVARVVRGEDGQERFLYRLELPGRVWTEEERILEQLAERGDRPVFYAGARSNWPRAEVVLTERVEDGAGLPPVDAGAAAPSDEDAELRARFLERVGPMLRNKSTDRTLDAAYQRLTEQLYRHHRTLTTTDEISQFYTRFRRYRWRGEGGPRVAVRAEYRTPDAGSARAIDTYFEQAGADPTTRLEPERFGIELLSTTSTPEALRTELREAFPEILDLRPGRPLFE